MALPTVRRRNVRRHVSQLNFSLDNLSLMALTLSVGFVVDDAIVMIENIVRHMEHGRNVPWKPPYKGSREIGFTIVSMTMSLVPPSSSPSSFMGGLIGRLLREFAITIAMASILISGFVSHHPDADAMQPDSQTPCRWEARHGRCSTTRFEGAFNGMRVRVPVVAYALRACDTAVIAMLTLVFR